MRVNYIGAPELFHLRVVAETLNKAFGYNIYQVGSSLEKRDYRDVDIRCILPDDEFDRLFPKSGWNGARWSVICAAVSEWISKRTGLPIDFQIQKQSEAKEFDGQRQALFVVYDEAFEK